MAWVALVFSWRVIYREFLNYPKKKRRVENYKVYPHLWLWLWHDRFSKLNWQPKTTTTMSNVDWLMWLPPASCCCHKLLHFTQQQLKCRTRPGTRYQIPDTTYFWISPSRLPSSPRPLTKNSINMQNSLYIFFQRSCRCRCIGKIMLIRMHRWGSRQ